MGRNMKTMIMFNKKLTSISQSSDIVLG